MYEWTQSIFVTGFMADPIVTQVASLTSQPLPSEISSIHCTLYYFLANQKYAFKIKCEWVRTWISNVDCNVSITKCNKNSSLKVTKEIKMIFNFHFKTHLVQHINLYLLLTPCNSRVPCVEPCDGFSLRERYHYNHKHEDFHLQYQAKRSNVRLKLCVLHGSIFNFRFKLIIRITSVVKSNLSWLMVKPSFGRWKSSSLSYPKEWQWECGWWDESWEPAIESEW